MHEAVVDVSRAEFERDLSAKLQDEIFLADIAPLLRAGIAWDVHRAGQLVFSRSSPGSPAILGRAGPKAVSEQDLDRSALAQPVRRGAVSSIAEALRCRAVGRCASQQATEQKHSLTRPELHVETEQRQYFVPTAIGLRHIEHTAKFGSGMDRA